jgi:hypothetical protein
MRATTISVICTFIPFFWIPVYWPFLLIYFLAILFLTFKKWWQHRKRFGYKMSDFKKTTSSTRDRDQSAENFKL